MKLDIFFESTLQVISFFFFFFLGAFFRDCDSSCSYIQKRNISSKFVVHYCFGAGGSDWLIKFDALVTLCVLIDSLDISLFGNWCHRFILCLFFLSLNDSKSLSFSPSSIYILFSLFGVTESLRIENFTLVKSNGTTKLLYSLISWPSILFSKSFYICPVQVQKHFFSTTHYQDSTNPLIM